MSQRHYVIYIIPCGCYRCACACAPCLFHVLAFDGCWYFIKPSSKRGVSSLLAWWQRWDTNPRLRRDWCLKPHSTFPCLLKWLLGLQPMKNPRFHHLSRSFLPYLQPLFHHSRLLGSFWCTAWICCWVPPRRSGRQRSAPFWHNQYWDLE